MCCRSLELVAPSSARSVPPALPLPLTASPFILGSRVCVRVCVHCTAVELKAEPDLPRSRQPLQRRLVHAETPRLEIRILMVVEMMSCGWTSLIWRIDDISGGSITHSRTDRIYGSTFGSGRK